MDANCMLHLGKSEVKRKRLGKKKIMKRLQCNNKLEDYYFFLINFISFTWYIPAVRRISSSIVPYETANYMDKTILSYRLKSIAFDYSPFSFYGKKLANNQQTMKTCPQNVIAEKSTIKNK